MKIIVFLTACLLGITNSSAIAAVQEKKAPCRLEVDNAHISSNILKKEEKFAVKVTFRSICNLDQTKLVMKVQIWKVGFGRNHPVTSPITRNFPYVKANRNVLIQDIYVYCKNTKRTYFYGVAEAHAYINGTQVNAFKVQSKKLQLLSCGT